MQEFILGWIHDPADIQEFPSKVIADEEAEEWVVVRAETLELAKAKYEQEFDRWQGSQKVGEWSGTYEPGTIDYDFAEFLAPKDRGAFLIAQALADSRDVIAAAMDNDMDLTGLLLLSNSPAIVQEVLDETWSAIQEHGIMDTMKAVLDRVVSKHKQFG